MNPSNIDDLGCLVGWLVGVFMIYQPLWVVKCPQSTNYTAICLPSRKLSKLDEPDMQETAGEVGTSS